MLEILHKILIIQLFKSKTGVKPTHGNPRLFLKIYSLNMFVNPIVFVGLWHLTLSKCGIKYEQNEVKQSQST